ncbi:MAG: discoidin domain-containing protein, partial [Chitinophagaceae bacterium]
RNGVLLLNLPPDKSGLIHEADVKSLQAWRALIDETYKTNRLKGAKVETPNGKNKKALLDNKYNTHWTTRNSDTTATIHFTLKAPQTFDVLLLQENIAVGQRIESFVLEYKQGGEWRKIAEGTTVGYKRLLRFDPVTASEVRLRILSSRLNPTLSAIGLYKQAQ